MSEQNIISSNKGSEQLLRMLSKLELLDPVQQAYVCGTVNGLAVVSPAKNAYDTLTGKGA